MTCRKTRLGDEIEALGDEIDACGDVIDGLADVERVPDDVLMRPFFGFGQWDHLVARYDLKCDSLCEAG